MHDHTHTSTNVFSLKGAVVKIDIIRLELKVGTICDYQGFVKGAMGGSNPPNFRTTITCAHLTNAQSRFAIVYLDSVLGPPGLA